MTTPEQNAEAPAARPVTLQDLQAREAACRLNPDYSKGYADEKRAAAIVMLNMAAYRVMPLLSWPGGPYWGQEVSTVDRRYALFNLAGALQIALRIRQDAEDKLGRELPPMKMADEPLGEMVMLGDLKEVIDGKGEHLNLTLARLLTIAEHTLRHTGNFALPWAFLLNIAPVLHKLNMTVYDLAGAYLEATNSLVPAPGETGGEVIYPGTVPMPTLEDLTPAQDPNGAEWAGVRQADGRYLADCQACGTPYPVAAPADPEPCPRCAASIVRPHVQPDGDVQ